MKSGIYTIESLSKNRLYVGSAVNIQKRWRDHKRMLFNGSHPNAKLQNHVNKYSLSDLLFEVVEFCDVSLLIVLEQKLIDDKSPFFNICKKAGSTLGLRFKLSESTKAKMSLALKGKPRKYPVTIHSGANHVQSKQVTRTDSNGCVKVYVSLSSVNADGFTFQNVHRAIKRGHRHKGYYWQYKLG